MILRRVQQRDIDPINEIWERCHKGRYGIPARRFLVTEAVTESNAITAYGLVRFFAEAMLYLDKDLNPYQQAVAFKMLMEQAITDAKLNGLDQLNVSVKDEEFEKILKDKFNFIERPKVLFLELDKEKSNG